MQKKMEISVSGPKGNALPDTIDTSRLQVANRYGSFEEWGPREYVLAAHTTRKLPRWPLNWNLQMKTLIFAAAFSAAFVLLCCYRQLTIGSNRGHGLLRSLAEGERKEGATPCLGTCLASKEATGGVSDNTEVASQPRVGSVTPRLIQVTEVCASVAPRLPLPFPMRVAELLLGFYIQGVAALPTLVGRQSDLQKLELLEAL